LAAGAAARATRRLVLLAAADPAGDAGAVVASPCPGFKHRSAGGGPGGGRHSGPGGDAGAVIPPAEPLGGVPGGLGAGAAGRARGAGGGDRCGCRSGPAGLAPGAGRAGARRAGGAELADSAEARARGGPRRGGGVPGARDRTDAGPTAALGAARLPRRGSGTRPAGTTGRGAAGGRRGRAAGRAGPGPGRAAAGAGHLVRTDGRDGTAQLLRSRAAARPAGPELARATTSTRCGQPTRPATRWRRAAAAARPLSQPPDATELPLLGYGLFVTEGFPTGSTSRASHGRSS
jgi:hypothetical protein